MYHNLSSKYGLQEQSVIVITRKGNLICKKNMTNQFHINENSKMLILLHAA